MPKKTKLRDKLKMFKEDLVTISIIISILGAGAAYAGNYVYSVLDKKYATNKSVNHKIDKKFKALSKKINKHKH